VNLEFGTIGVLAISNVALRILRIRRSPTDWLDFRSGGVSMKTLAALASMLLAFFAAPAYSAGYSNWSVPSYVELVNDGALISGYFGDPHGCGQAGFIFVRDTNSKFKEIVAMAYSALISGRELKFYSSSCTQVIAHWSGNVINVSQEGQSVTMR